ncbi:MAG: hypothetical protein LBS89_01745 [Zoogloeaceae bacterium]|jgi:hypothetical protein|nr:hypothetical protein [Zoogloeaceae bacterium]
MTDFKEILLRLKQQLGVEDDKDVAEALGLKANAFNARKKRESFPETELYALAAKRPDLHLDVEYVLTGRAFLERFGEKVRTATVRSINAVTRKIGEIDAHSAMIEGTPMSHGYNAILASFASRLSDEDKVVLLSVAESLSKKNEG